MNRIQKLSLDLYRRRLQERLDLDPSTDGRNTRALKMLWHRSRVEELKRKLQQFSVSGPSEEASDFLFHSSE